MFVSPSLADRYNCRGLDGVDRELAPPQDKQSLSDSTTEFHDAPSTQSSYSTCHMYKTQMELIYFLRLLTA